MDNYEDCVRWAVRNARTSDARILDYGCGAGQVVAGLCRSGLDAFGCDVFYEGGDYSHLVDRDLLGARIRRMEGSAIPFENDFFDLVLSNQVLEHVDDLEGALREISRVAKPGALILSLFPDKGDLREGHCGVPLLHWFPKRTRVRVYWAAAFRSLGFGYHKGDKTVLRWSEDFCNWLDRWTHYRSKEKITRVFSAHFDGLRHLEQEWLQARLGAKARVAGWLPIHARQFIVQKLAGLVFTVTKPAASVTR